MVHTDPVLVVDDEPKFRSLVATLLAGVGLECREAGSGGEAVALARQERPALIILDVRLPDMSGLEICQQLRGQFGEQLPILLVSGVKRDSLDLSAGLLLGADDYVVKPFDADEFLARVRRLLVRSAAAAAPNLTISASPSGLTKREREILQLLGEGRSRDSIAHTLVISPKTVASHVQSLLGKLGVHSQAQAVAAAYQSGLLRPTNGAADVQASSLLSLDELLEAEAV
jgi:two-component system nitrate/nitrite response regulator NarL